MSRKALLSLLPLVLLAGCGGGTDGPQGSVPTGLVIGGEDTVSHIHGVGIDPADDALIIATHTGLFRAATGQRRPERVGDRRQDTMGFTVLGPGSFLGSGHPDPRDGLPSSLGLIRSDDAGRSWRSVSLMGRTDFHVLRAAGRRIYAADAASGTLYVSSDAGRSWRRTTPDAPVIDLAIDPGDADHVVASDEQGLVRSRDAGRTWRRLGTGPVGLLAWGRELVLIDADGGAHRSPDGGETFTRVGDVGGRPSATSADGDGRPVVALADNSVRTSGDGGRRWTVRLGAQ